MRGRDKLDATSLDLQTPSLFKALSGDIRGLKIGLPRECFNNKGLDNQVKSRVLDAARTLEKLGATLVEVDLPFLDYVIPAYYIMATAEASSNLARFDGVKYGFRSAGYEDLTDLYNKTRSEGFGEEVKKRILLGTFVLSSGYYDAYYNKALKVKSLIHSKFEALFEEVDLILSPVAPTTAPELGKSLSDPLEMYLSDIFTVSVNIAGLPGLSVPCGFDADGMPVGAQLIGQRFMDAKVLNAGYAFQRATDYHTRRPEVK